jgi:hypothetical protein
MLRFKEFLKINNIFESLSSNQRNYVDSLDLDTSRGVKNSQGIIPAGETHTEIPLKDPMRIEIDDHLANTPVTDRNGKHLGFYKRDPENPKMAIHPDGRKVKLSGTLKGDPDLLERYARIGSNLGSNVRADSGNEITNKSDQRWEIQSHKNRRVFITRHPYAMFGKSEGNDGADNDGRKGDIPWSSCNKWASKDIKGHASEKLPDDVREGGASAWLCHENETNPDNPTMARGRIALNPWHACTSDGKILKDTNGDPLHTILRPSKQYGEEDAFGSFGASVRQHLDEHQPMIHDYYKLNPKVYQKDTPRKIIRKPMSKDEISNALEHGSEDDKLNALQQNSITTDHITKALDKDQPVGVRLAAIRHEKANEDHITKALDKDQPVGVRLAAIEHKNANEGHITKALDKDQPGVVRLAAIRHKKANEDHITKALDKDQPVVVRLLAIQHEKANEGHITKALEDDDRWVRQAAIQHKNANEGHITKALDKDQPLVVRKAAIKHEKVNEGHITKALEDTDGQVRLAAIKHKNANGGHITKALGDPDEYIRLAAIKRENANEGHITKALEDPDKLIRLAAIQHEKVNEGHITKALEDDDARVSDYARNRLKELTRS